MGDDDYAMVLRREFAEEEGSFLFQLHYRIWDQAAFHRLTAAMLACCQTYDEHDQRPTLFGPAYDRSRLPRWLSAGFWFVVTSVEDFASPHSASEGKITGPDYYAQAYQHVRDLAEWFFTGECGYLDPIKHFAPI